VRLAGENVPFSGNDALCDSGATHVNAVSLSPESGCPQIAIHLEFAIISEQIMAPDKGEITLLLDRIAMGDREAEDALMPRIYFELHRLAMARLRTERPDHTLQATALVHEVYLRLCGSDEIRCHDRAHFFAVAARLMRHILVDYARRHNAGKRNTGSRMVPLDEAITVSASQSAEALDVDELLVKLATLSPRQAQVVEMRFFGGLTEEEIAEALDKNVRTIKRDWLMARAWLHEQLQPGDPGSCKPGRCKPGR
jgi:RNA polymerase sigma factor (TIGR02999 family)